jgi:hypothetical protein
VEKKRGRPPKPEAQKRQQIGVRISPTLKSELVAAAKKNERSVGQEAEMRLQQSFDLQKELGDEETHHLLRAIASEIDHLQTINKNKRWHKDLQTWASVAEMMGQGPIQRFKPYPPHHDDAFDPHRQRLREVSAKKRVVFEVFRENQISIDTKLPLNTIQSGLLAGVNGHSRILPRRLEMKQIESLSLPAPLETELLEALEQLEVLDQLELAVRSSISELLEPYVEVEKEGREIFFEWQERNLENLARNQAKTTNGKI